MLSLKASTQTGWQDTAERRWWQHVLGGEESGDVVHCHHQQTACKSGDLGSHLPRSKSSHLLLRQFLLWIIRTLLMLKCWNFINLLRIDDSEKMVALAAQFLNLSKSQHENRATRSQNQTYTTILSVRILAKTPQDTSG